MSRIKGIITSIQVQEILTTYRRSTIRNLEYKLGVEILLDGEKVKQLGTLIQVGQELEFQYAGNMPTTNIDDTKKVSDQVLKHMKILSQAKISIPNQRKPHRLLRFFKRTGE